jgi:DNA polymerase-1
VAHYTLDERKGGHKLKPLADDYFDSGDYEAELFNYIAKKSGRFSRIPRHVLYRYNAMDTELTLRLAHTLEAELKEQGLYNRPFLFPMMAAVPMLLDAELYGVGIDWEEADRIDVEEIKPELQVVAGKLREISGRPDLNPLSSKRVNDILYDEMNFPIIEVRTRAAGKRIKKRSSQIAVMDGWAKMWEQGKLHVSKRAWEFAQTLRYYRHVRKMQGSYVRKWQNFRGTDDRVHTYYMLRGTVTGRLVATDPPLQTIPSKVHDKWGPLIANMHVPEPGWKYLYADYSQGELMIAACYSGDEFMIRSFQKGDADYHSEVAVAAFGPNFTKDERQACKKLTFGWLFGGNVYEIAMNALQFEGPVAERFAHEWDDLFKGVIAWRERQGELMLEQGYVQSVFGRRRRYLLLTSRNVGKAKRVAINAPIQSALSDLNLISATRLHEIYKSTDYAKVVLLIHDSLIMEVRDDKVEEVKAVMHEIMIDTPRKVFPQVPFRADVKIGERLGDLT